MDPSQPAKSHDHATKYGAYSCEVCSQTRKELKHEKKKSMRQARIDPEIGLEEKRQVQDYPYDQHTYNPHGEKYVDHRHRKTTKSILADEILQNYAKTIPKFLKDVWNLLDETDLEELAFKLNHSIPIVEEDYFHVIGSEFDFDDDPIDNI